MVSKKNSPLENRVGFLTTMLLCQHLNQMIKFLESKPNQKNLIVENIY